MAAEDVINEIKGRLEALLAPIDGGVGVDVSYDEAFDVLKNEVEKLQSVSGGKVDWGAIAVGADEILSEKSKDFRVALYYAAAKAHTDSLAGWLDGFVVLNELIAQFWEPMYPPLKRPKARGNLCSWFGDITCPLFLSYQPTPREADVVRALDQMAASVDGELQTRLGDSYPGMMNVRNLCRNLMASLPKDAPAPTRAAAAPPPSTAAPVEAAAPAPQYEQQQAAPAYAPPPASTSSGGYAAPSAGSISTVDDAMTAVGQCATLLMRIGDTLRAADPGNPLAYRYGRTGFWLEVTQLPPADGGVTMIPPPPDGIRATLDGMMAAENYLAVIQSADESAATFIMWLDLHRYIANAMDRLGAVFINAKKALVRELAVLLARMPQLPSLCFSDGTPLADGQTKMWLEAEVQTAGDGGGGGGGNGAAGFLDAPLAEARTLAASGKLAEAVDVVGKASAAAPSGADRFRGRLAVAKLCLQSGQFAIARAQLEGLIWTIDQHRLLEWEPELCAELYASLYAAHRGLNKGEEVPPEARARELSAFERLCQLDAGAALKLSSE